MTEQWENKEEYLKLKAYIGKCSNNCIEKRIEYNLPKLQCGTCFWNAVQLPIHKIPECSRCIIDTKKYKELLKNNKEKEFKPTCCKSCLWWDWFENKRNSKHS